MSESNFPSNIKQIGGIDKRLRVYIEDYAYSFLVQMNKKDKNKDVVSALVGRCMIIDQEKVLFITGTIMGLHSEVQEEVLRFTKKSETYIEEQRLKHFGGLEIVGWCLSQPGYGNYLNDNCVNYHRENFRKPYQVMLVMDMMEKINTLYNEDRKKGKLDELEGYFIYYDKNDAMENYIKEYKENVEKIELKKDSRKNQLENEKIYVKDNSVEIKKEEVINELREAREKPRDVDIVGIHRNKLSGNMYKRKEMEQKTIVNSLVAVSGFLFILTFIVGVGAFKSSNKVVTLEGEMATLRDAYNVLVAYMNDSAQSIAVFGNSELELKTETEIINSTLDKIKKLEEEIGYRTDDIELEEDHEVEGTFREESTEGLVSRENEVSEVMGKRETIVPNYYIVKKGDSLIGISNKFYGNRNRELEIMELNDIEDPNKINFGMKILLPK